MSIFEPFITFFFLWILSTLCEICSSIALEWKILWLHFDRNRKYNIRYRWGFFKDQVFTSLIVGFALGSLLWIPIFPIWILIKWILSEFQTILIQLLIQ